MTLGNAANAKVRVDRVVQGVRPRGRADPGEIAGQYGWDISIVDWRKRLVCGRAGGWRTEIILDYLKGDRRWG
jgi:hypothetical protein